MNKLKTIKRLRHKLANGSPTVGSWMQIPSSEVAELMGGANFDWVAIDMEHGSINVNQLPNLFRALELGETLPLVRLPEGSERYCARILDAGAGGLIVPMVTEAKQLEKIITASSLPPSGKRGVGFSRANLYGVEFKNYIQEAQNPLIVAMIESSEAINNLEDILKVKGLDALMIGPYDLSASLGVTANFKNSKFTSTLSKIKDSCSKAGVPLGVHVVEPKRKDLNMKIKQGYQFLAYGIDTVFLTNSIMNLEIKR